MDRITKPIRARGRVLLGIFLCLTVPMAVLGVYVTWVVLYG